MSDQNQVARPSTPPPDRGGARLTFFDLAAKKGAFMFEPEEGAAYVPTSFVMGYYVQHWLEWDPGKPDAPKEKDRIPARWKLRIILREAECERGRVGYAWVTIAPKGAFYGAAHGLAQCKPNDFLGFKAVPGEDSCFVNVDQWDGAAWTSHLTPKNDGRSFDERYEEAVALIRDAPGYQAYEKRTKDEGPSGPTQGAAAQTQSNAATPKPITADPLRDDAALKRAEATGRLAKPTKDAFGFHFPTWPVPAIFAQPATDRQREMYSEKLQARGLWDEKNPGWWMESVGKAVHDVIGFPDEYRLSKAGFGILIEFLMKVDDEGIELVKFAVDPFAEPEAEAIDENDPYA